MEFRDNEAIYLQIVAYVSNNILMGKWPAEERIPSVRDMAIELQVNLNTVMRSYEYLQNLGVIYNKRGLGLFVSPDGYDKVKAHRKQRFVQQDLPAFLTNMKLLGINPREIEEWYEKFNLNNPASKTDNNDENK